MSITDKPKFLCDLLTYNKDYEEIQKNMIKDEFYFLQGREYDFITPIKIIEDSKPIGFMAGDYIETKETIKPMITDDVYEDIKHLPNMACLVDLFYLLPEYRDKGVFKLYLQKIINIVGLYNVILHLPNRFVINSLLNNGLARMMEYDVVTSKLWLGFEDNETNELVISHYYDLNYCAIIDMSEKHRLSPVLDVDDKCFNASKNRGGFKNVYEDDC